MRGSKSNLTKAVVILNILLLFFVATIITYYFYFYPKKDRYQLSDQVMQNSNPQIALQLEPESIDIPSQKITVLSSIKFSEEELTNLFILSLSDMPDMKQYINGLKVHIDGDFINLDTNVVYKSFPLKATFTFQGKATNGKGVLHYESGKVGFLDIPQDILLSSLKDSPYLRVDKASHDIILDLAASKFVEITDIKTEGDSLKVNFRGTLSLLE